MLLLPRLPSRLLRRSCLPTPALAPQTPAAPGRGRARKPARLGNHRGYGSMTHDPKTPHRGPAITRRRAMTVMGVATGLPWIGVADRSDKALLLYQWDGTSLGSPSRLLLYHHDRATASRIVGECATEIERLERIFALYRTDSEITRLNRDSHIEFPSVDLLTVLSQSQILSSLSRGAF